MKILFVIPSLGHTGSAKQLRLLAGNLPRDQFERCICVLGREGNQEEALRKAGIRVQALGWSRWIDLGALRSLRQLLREFRPDVVHVWTPTALRAACLSGINGARLVLSNPLAGLGRPDAMNRLDRWLLGRVERVIVQGPAQADRCRRGGIPAEKLLAIPPAVEVAPEGPRLSGSDLPAPLRSLLFGRDLPALLGSRLVEDSQARFLACVGPLRTSKGFRDAIWTLDILRYLVDGLHLLLLGDGPDRSRLREFIQISRTTDCVHLLGAWDEVAAWLARAEITWVPSWAPTGVNVALEAMAAGRPVVASHWPELSEVVLDGQTGFLVPPGDKMALARQTRVLLENPEQRRQFGEAGQQRAGRLFAVSDLVRRFADLYENQRGIV